MVLTTAIQSTAVWRTQSRVKIGSMGEITSQPSLLPIVPSPSRSTPRPQRRHFHGPRGCAEAIARLRTVAMPHGVNGHHRVAARQEREGQQRGPLQACVAVAMAHQQHRVAARRLRARRQQHVEAQICRLRLGNRLERRQCRQHHLFVEQVQGFQRAEGETVDAQQRQCRSRQRQRLILEQFAAAAHLRVGRDRAQVPHGHHRLHLVARLHLPYQAAPRASISVVALCVVNTEPPTTFRPSAAACAAAWLIATQ